MNYSVQCTPATTSSPQDAFQATGTSSAQAMLKVAPSFAGCFRSPPEIIRLKLVAFMAFVDFLNSLHVSSGFSCFTTKHLESVSSAREERLWYFGILCARSPLTPWNFS